MADSKFNAAATLESPAWDARAVTLADADLPRAPTTGLYVGGAGNVVVKMASGQDDVSFAGVPAGTILPIRVDQVKTASTASNIVALYHG